MRTTRHGRITIYKNCNLHEEAAQEDVMISFHDKLGQKEKKIANAPNSGSMYAVLTWKTHFPQMMLLYECCSLLILVTCMCAEVH